MTKFKINQGQTGLDIVNNTYASQDYIGQLYTDNETFDINEMLTGEVEYEKLNNQIVNQISNNDYVFKNGDVVVFSKVATLTVADSIFNTFLDIQAIDLDTGLTSTLDYLYKNNDTGERNIFSNASENNVKLFNTENNLEIHVDSSIGSGNFVYSNIDFNGSDITNVDLNNIQVGNNFILDISNMQMLSDFSFLNTLSYTDLGNNDTITINASNMLVSSTRMLAFTAALAASSLSEPGDAGYLILSSDDRTPTGTDWTALVSNGWEIVVA